MLDKLLPALTFFKSDPISRKTLRYAIGMVIMFAFVFLINWPLSFLFIVFGSLFLLGTKPSWKFAFSFVFKFAIASIAAIAISYLFIDFYLLYLLVIGLILLHVFYADDSSLDHILKIAMCITFVLLPLTFLKSPMLSFTIAINLCLGLAGALLLTIILFELMPDIPVANAEVKDDHAHAHPTHHPTDKERFRLALKSLAVIYPVIVLFYFNNMHGYLLIIVFASILGSDPYYADDLSKAKIRIRSPFFGGIIAVFMYEILIIVPNFTFFMLMIFALALYGGHQLITGGKQAVNIQNGMSAIIIIFVGVAAAPDSDVDAKMWTRVAYMTIVTVYVVLNFKLFENLFPQTNKSS